MIKYSAFVIIIALRIIYQPGNANANHAPFASPMPAFATPAKLVTVNGNVQNNKVILNWTVSENETADQFEIEKSTDGKNFTLAALVFGTDKAETGKYEFFEKAGKKKMIYRIKLINKNKETEYSPVVEIDPAA